jgi:hypothetical protein
VRCWFRFVLCYFFFFFEWVCAACCSVQQQVVMHLPPPLPLPSPSATKSNMHVHPLLTPSGRAFTVGGKVQNISSDPLSPCIMYWPDNEPFLEQGQIRPSGLMSVQVSRRFDFSDVALDLGCSVVEFSCTPFSFQQPPILNTGNRGPISHMCFISFPLHLLRAPDLAWHLQQPGDWICLKCNHLNWRRRKVCQTCLPCKFCFILIFWHSSFILFCRR